MGAENTLLDTGGLLAEASRQLTNRFFDQGPHRWGRYLHLWGALVVGAAVGAVTYRVFAFNALWIAVGAATLAAAAFRNAPSSPAGPYAVQS